MRITGTSFAQWEYETAPGGDPQDCVSSERGEGVQSIDFESDIFVAVAVGEPIQFLVMPRGVAEVTVRGIRHGSYRYSRSGPKCSEPPPVDTSGCGPPRGTAVANVGWANGKLTVGMDFGDVDRCPWSTLDSADSFFDEKAVPFSKFTSSEAQFVDGRVPVDLDRSGGHVVFDKLSGQTTYTITIIPAD
jgi:hypothetical protein